jgi:hypothetical protein
VIVIGIRQKQHMTPHKGRALKRGWGNLLGYSEGQNHILTTA